MIGYSTPPPSWICNISGFHPEIISVIDEIQRMSRMVRTAYGDSNLKYGGDIIPDEFSHFIMGLCQRHGSATQTWLVISSVLFSILLAQGFGIHFANSSVK